MKTKKVRPVLVNSDTWQPLVYSTNQYGGLFKSKYYSPMKEMGDTYKQLILISTDPNEKIEDGDLYYGTCSTPDGTVRGSVCKYNKLTTLMSSDGGKVIATQDQLPETYIQQFIEEYNADEVKDIEIEMEYYNKPMSDLFLIQKPKLTNGFITIVEQKEGVTFSLNEKEKQEVLEYYCSLK